MSEELKIICSWCQKKVRGPDNGRVSHGVCPACKLVVEEQIKKAHEEIRRRKKEKDEGASENPFLMNRPEPGWWFAIHPYVSPRERDLTTNEAWVRVIAYGIKD